MKHLKAYEFFNFLKRKKGEGIDINVVRDILYDLEDHNLKAVVGKDYNRSFNPQSGGYEELPDPIVKENILIRISKNDGGVFNTDLVKDCVDRIFEYIKQSETNINNVEFMFQDPDPAKTDDTTAYRPRMKYKVARAKGELQHRSSEFPEDEITDLFSVYFTVK